VRILGIGKRAENAAAMQGLLRAAGYDATNFAITDDAEGDALLVAELQSGGYEAVTIGSFINGQHAELAATPQTTAWFNRILNLIAEHAPGTKVVLVRKPSEVVEAVHAVLRSG
jgi:hypothetical protein